MKRWNVKKEEFIENPKIDVFLDDILIVCKKHKLSLSHEDSHGAFEVMKYNEDYSKQLMCTHDLTQI